MPRTPRRGSPNWRRPGSAWMLVFRWLILLSLVAALLCFAMYIGTGQVRWRGHGLRVLKWTVVTGLVFFAVLILERMAIIL